MEITAAQLVEIIGCRAQRAELWAQPLNMTLAEYQIDTPRRVAAFVAQVGHETGRLIYVRELWGPTAQQRLYETPSRKSKELGNTQPGDGMRYRGRGLIQRTGRGGYIRARDRLRKRFPATPDFEATPELLEQPRWAALSAGDFWDDHHLNLLADDDEFEAMTRIINGGINGLAERKAFYAAGLLALAATA